MNIRSVQRVALLTFSTMGVYAYYWFAKLSKEMKSKGQSPPHIFQLILTTIISLATFGLLAFTIGVFPRQAPPTQVSDSCWTQWVLSEATETRPNHVLSASCADSVAASLEEQDQSMKLEGKVLLLLLVAFVAYSVLLRWNLQFARALDKSTDGKINATSTLLMLEFLPFFVSIPLLQKQINSVQPALQKTK